MEHADDDILMDRRQHYRRMRPIDEEATPSIESMLRIVNSLTNRNFLIVFTIFIILIFQFRESIMGWFIDIRVQQRGLLDSCLDVWDTIAFYLQTVWRMLNVFISVPDNNDTLQQQQNGGPTTRRSRGRHGAMPELEEPIPNGNGSTAVVVDEREEQGSVEQYAIEPAFLDPKQYPPGWLVYDPKLGVVSKEYANGKIH